MCERFVEKEYRVLIWRLELESAGVVMADSSSNSRIRNLCLGSEERNSMRKKQRNVGSRLS